MDGTNKPRLPRQSSRAGSSNRQRDSSYGARMMMGQAGGGVHTNSYNLSAPGQSHPHPDFRAPSPNLLPPSIVPARAPSPQFADPSRSSALPYLTNAGPTTNALLKGRESQLVGSLAETLTTNGMGTGSSNGNKQQRQPHRRSPPKPPQQPLPALPPAPSTSSAPKFDIARKSDLPPVPYPEVPAIAPPPPSTRPVNANRPPRRQSMSPKTTPLKKAGAEGSSSSSSIASAGKFTSPPPPMAAPPRDVPLPPLPPLPPFSSKGSSSELVGRRSESGEVRPKVNGSSHKEEKSRGMEELGKGRKPPSLQEDSTRYRQASAPNYQINGRYQREVEPAANGERSRSASAAGMLTENSRSRSAEALKALELSLFPDQATIDRRVEEKQDPCREPYARSRTPEPLGTVALAGVGEVKGNASRQRKGSLELDRAAQAESSRQAQLRGLGLGGLPEDAGRGAAVEAPQQPRQPKVSFPPRRSGEMTREMGALPGQSPQLNGSWPVANKGKGSTPASAMMSMAGLTNGGDRGMPQGRRSEDAGILLNRNAIMEKPAMAPRKSSGGFRALFSRTKKDKSGEKEKAANAKQDAPPAFAPGPPLIPRRRASEDMLRTRRQDDEFRPPIRQTPTPEPGMLNRIGASGQPAFQRTVSEQPARMLHTPAEHSPPSSREDPSDRRSSMRSPASSSTEKDESNAKTPTKASMAIGTNPAVDIPHSKSLHLLDLPQLDLSMGASFENIFNRIDAKPSPASPKKSVSTSSSGRRRSRSFSEFSHPVKSPSTRAGHDFPSFDSNSSLLADLAAYRNLDMLEEQPEAETPVPALSMSDHGRTLSTTSSQVIDSSPPRTPGTSDPGQVVIAGSSSGSCSLDGSTSVDAAEIGVAGKVALPASVERVQKQVRPKLLQLAETSVSSSTIVEQDEAQESGNETSHSRLATVTTPQILEPPIEIKPIVATTTSDPSKTVSKVRQIPLRRKSTQVSSDLTGASLADNMRRILNMFRLAASMKNTDKAGLIRNDLLEYLVEGEKRGYDRRDRLGNAAIRNVCVEWVNVLMNELKVDQAANERGACLEAVSAILESPTLSWQALADSPEDALTFRSLMAKVMSFVLGKLSGKGVFHNTLLFAGRMLAFAFFRIEGIAFQLLAALPTKPAQLMRFARAVNEFSPRSEKAPVLGYPAHLQPLVYDNSQAYTRRINDYAPEYHSPSEDEAFHFRPGNWLRRWQSDDSELFPAFYKAYHRQLAVYMADAVDFAERQGTVVPSAILLRAPGYAHLAAVFGIKTHSYIVGAVNAVTTTSTASHFTADESVGLRSNTKPPVLETANRRLTEIILNLSNSRMFVQNKSGKVLEVEGTELWGSMTDIWLKYLISRTSLYSPKGVFCLLDFLDGVVAPTFDQLASPNPDGQLPTKPSLADVPHLISIIRLILTETDHHLTLAKCIAFVWTHYDTLCARVEDREALCLKLLLDPAIFERLVLFWSQSVRSYVLRLVIFRLGHVFTSPEDVDNHEMEVASVQLLHRRLERIRKRHDELEPHDLMLTPAHAARKLDGEEDISAAMPRSKSTITMVETAEADEPQSTRAERLLGLGGALTNAPPEGVTEPESASGKGKGKAASWFKKPFTKQKKRKTGGESDSDNERGKLPARPSMTLNRTESSSPQPPPTARAGLLKSALDMQEPSSPAAASTKSAGAESNDSFEGDVSALQPRNYVMPKTTVNPPPIRVSTPEPSSSTPASPRSPSRVQFEFEIPTASPRSDAFDRRPLSLTTSPHGPASSHPQRMPASPHMSRSFSRRSSLLHPVAVGIVEGPASPSFRRSLASTPEPPGYDKKFHPYCIRMLAELEDVQKEYDEWWGEDGPGRQENAPPRLAVPWPFSDDED